MAKKKTDDMTEQRAITTMEIASELRAVTEQIIEAGGEITELQVALLQEWHAALETKGQNIAHLLQKMSNDAAYYQSVEDIAKARRKAIEGADKRLREYLAAAMQQADVKSIKADGIFSITLCDGRPSVQIEDPAKLEIGRYADYVETIKPRSDEIKKAILDGEDVPGARVEYGRPYLLIR
jgi:hypothetical protein